MLSAISASIRKIPVTGGGGVIDNEYMPPDGNIGMKFANKRIATIAAKYIGVDQETKYITLAIESPRVLKCIPAKYPKTTPTMMRMTNENSTSSRVFGR